LVGPRQQRTSAKAGDKEAIAALAAAVKAGDKEALAALAAAAKAGDEASLQVMMNGFYVVWGPGRGT
jgi:hypothetical protein